jgi:hypothetical protein
MAKKAINGLPEYKAPPPPPPTKEQEKQKPHDQVVTDVLDILRRYTPEQQNFIIGETLKETTYWRHQEMQLQRERLSQAEGTFKQFLDLQHLGEQVMKEMESKKGF